MIEIKDISMHYGPTVALDKVSFSVNEGDILGLLGPNGAGKSTLMKILTTFIYPSHGTAQVGGHDILEHPLQVRCHHQQGGVFSNCYDLPRTFCPSYDRRPH